uniref:SKI family transcriptional corepressor 2-like n=1 Tax=Fragaria vesca subsp. vesca TaxID=101020 RepID=UPI0005CB616A|nr:PREDICTED: SKI family transcriptional corepressor 2-like [Fragaria vesca subsp. vesca]
MQVRMFSLVIPPPQIPVPLKVALELAPQAESSGSHGGGGNRRTGIGAPPPPPPPPPPMFGFPFHKRFLQEQPSMVSFPRITPKISLKMEGKKAITPVPQKRFFHDL